jgi:hypothetical protein
MRVRVWVWLVSFFWGLACFISDLGLAMSATKTQTWTNTSSLSRPEVCDERNPTELTDLETRKNDFSSNER